jgi:hypothetical protein
VLDEAPFADVAVGRDGETWSALPVRLLPSADLARLPEGEWQVIVQDVNRARRASQTCRVRPGETTELELAWNGEPERR